MPAKSHFGEFFNRRVRQDEVTENPTPPRMVFRYEVSPGYFWPGL
jgi:hypothetical protein